MSIRADRLMPPTPENTPGLFLEHFDLSPASGECDPSLVYPAALQAARDTATFLASSFRSYSDGQIPSTMDNFVRRNIRSFPTYILFRDGVELGRTSMLVLSAEPLIAWASKLLE